MVTIGCYVVRSWASEKAEDEVRKLCMFQSCYRIRVKSYKLLDLAFVRRKHKTASRLLFFSKQFHSYWGRTREPRETFFDTTRSLSGNSTDLREKADCRQSKIALVSTNCDLGVASDLKTARKPC